RVAVFPGRYRPRPSTAAVTGAGGLTFAPADPMSDPARFAGPQLPALYALFPPADDMPEYEFVPADEVPPPYHGLLVHEHHMTVTVDCHRGDSVAVRTLARRQTGDHYARKILLALHGSGQIVQFGIVRADLRYCNDAVRAEILAGRTPFGRILIKHNVLRRI